MATSGTTSEARKSLLRASLPAARAAAKRQKPDSPGLLSQVCLDTGVDAAEVVALSPDAFGVDAYGFDDLMAVVPDFSVLSFGVCCERRVVSTMHRGTLEMVVDDPWDEAQRQWMTHQLGRAPVLAWADARAIDAALAAAKRRLSAINGHVNVAGLDRPERQSDLPVGPSFVSAITLESIERTSNIVVRFVDAAIYDAWKSGASDIHFEGSHAALRVMLRLDGILVEAARLDDPARAAEVISRIKVLAQLDITERRIPQDGRFRVVLGGRNVDLRVSIMPSLHGEDAVLRLLDKTRLRSDSPADGRSEAAESPVIALTSLGFDPVSLARIRALAKRPNGMMLVTGPTGSGKTTTLYAVIQEIHTGQDKIVTIEDPVEYELEDVLQIPVNEKKGLTFARGLRSILRHDPDKILVGEIRDAETADIAIQAALTGHLVFTTVHANNVYDVISRFLHMNVDLYSFMSAINGIVAQRLVRKNCPHCSQVVRAETYEPSLLAALDRAAPDRALWRLHRGTGCDHCRRTGYSGRVAVAEVLRIDDRLRGMVVQRAPIEEIKAYAAAEGIVPIEQGALELVVRGQTSMEEVDRVVAIV